MSVFDKKIGERFRLQINENGMSMHDYVHGCNLVVRRGWNALCTDDVITMSVDEMRDLRYIIDRGIEAATESKR